MTGHRTWVDDVSGGTTVSVRLQSSPVSFEVPTHSPPGEWDRCVREDEGCHWKVMAAMLLLRPAPDLKKKNHNHLSVMMANGGVNFKLLHLTGARRSAERANSGRPSHHTHMFKGVYQMRISKAYVSPKAPFGAHHNYASLWEWPSKEISSKNCRLEQQSVLSWSLLKWSSGE